MIAIGRNTGGQGTPEDLRNIELMVPGIGAGDQDPADRVCGTMNKATLAQLEIARVLMKHGRKNGAGHEVLDGSVGGGRPKSFSITFRPLAVAGLTIFRLADT